MLCVICCVLCAVCYVLPFATYLWQKGISAEDSWRHWKCSITWCKGPYICAPIYHSYKIHNLSPSLPLCASCSVWLGLQLRGLQSGPQEPLDLHIDSLVLHSSQCHIICKHCKNCCPLSKFIREKKFRSQWLAYFDSHQSAWTLQYIKYKKI